ncbi:MAG: histidine kinase [Bacteroidales bacterium]|nr:histidine kinase [Bacteroidales bacterium]
MNGLKGHKYIYHIIGWLLYTAIYLLLFLDFLSIKGAFIRLLMIIPIQAVIFYLNSSYLMPFFLEKGKYFRYGFYILVIVGMLIGFSVLFPVQKATHRKLLMRSESEFEQRKKPNDTLSLSPGPNGEIRKGSPFGRNLMQGFTILSILFFSTIYRNALAKREKENNEAQLESKKLQADLQFLKAQINPHFLFNAMNNIYSLSLLKKDKAPKAIHELSEMLRYVIYESEDRFVSLEKEIKYISNYIDLQLLKDDSINSVNFIYPDNIKHCHIAPMLLIPFVENSFKHSNIDSDSNAWIDIRLELSGNMLAFNCTNSIPVQELKKDNFGGIGLENVKKRLFLIYKTPNLLDIKSENNTFKVVLNIPIYEHKMSDYRR